MGCTPLRQSRSNAFRVRHGCRRQHLPHLPISADGTPVCGTRPRLRERREAYPVSSVPVPCTGGGTSPRVRPGNMSGTDVARYLHAGDEAARCRRDPGGRRFVPSGPHPHRADAGCADRHKTFFLILRRITMATPKWFDANAYMQNKLAQLKAQEPDAGWTLDKVYDTFRDADFVGTEGQYEHFVQYGAAEEVAPNAYFDADEYYAAKAKQYYEEELKQEFTGSEEQVAYVKSLIKDAGMNAWTHYQQFGSAEGVNPSNAFDASDYCAAKAEAMNNAGQKAPDGTDWTAESIAKAIDDAGMSVLEHYLTYAGTGEGEVAAGSTYPVSGDEQVSKPGETFYLTDDRDSLVGTSGDDVFRATTAGDMNDFDTVDGGAGNDTLEVYTDDALKGTFTNIENLVIVDATKANNDQEIDLSSFSGSFTLKGGSDTAVTVTNVAGQKLVLDGVTSGTTLTAKMDGTQTSVKLVNEGSTNATFQAEGDKLASMDLTTNANTTLADGNGNTVKNVAITALADATITLTDLTNLENVTVAGAGAVGLTVAGSVKTVDATANAGGVTVDLSSAMRLPSRAVPARIPSLSVAPRPPMIWVPVMIP